MTVTMGAEAALGATPTTVKMILRGGPLDGSQQIVQALPTTPGSLMWFHLPSYQTFDEDGTVVSQGLTAVYVLLGEGGAPGPGDSWTTSWVFLFGTDLPTPPPGTLVWMVPWSTLTVAGTTAPLPINPTMATLVGASGMVINGTTAPGAVVITLEADTDLEFVLAPIPYGTVSMYADAGLVSDPNTNPTINLNGATSMNVTPS